jgi:hypothetical protein
MNAGGPGGVQVMVLAHWRSSPAVAPPLSSFPGGTRFTLLG